MPSEDSETSEPLDPPDNESDARCRREWAIQPGCRTRGRAYDKRTQKVDKTTQSSNETGAQYEGQILLARVYRKKEDQMVVTFARSNIAII